VKVHYSREGRGASICGANNNRNIGHRTHRTSERALVTCVKCRAYIDSGRAAAVDKVLNEIAANGAAGGAQ